MANEDPFVTLVAVTKPLVMSAVRRYLRTTEDHDDVYQDIYLTLYTRWRKGKLKNLQNLEAYVYTVSKHTCLNLNRKKKTIPLEDIPEPGVPYPTLSLDDAAILREAINRVPEKYAVLLRLVLLGYGPSELTQTLQLPLNTIKSLLLRGKKKLKNTLEKEGYHGI